MAFANGGNQGAPGMVRDTLSNYPARQQQQQAFKQSLRAAYGPNGQRDISVAPPDWMGSNRAAAIDARMRRRFGGTPSAGPEQPGVMAPLADDGFAAIPNGQMTGPSVSQALSQNGAPVPNVNVNTAMPTAASATPATATTVMPTPMDARNRGEQLEGFKDALRGTYGPDGQQSEIGVVAPNWLSAQREATIRNRIGNRLGPGQASVETPLLPPYTTGQKSFPAPAKGGQPAAGLMPGLA